MGTPKTLIHALQSLDQNMGWWYHEVSLATTKDYKSVERSLSVTFNTKYLESLKLSLKYWASTFSISGSTRPVGMVWCLDFPPGTPSSRNLYSSWLGLESDKHNPWVRGWDPWYLWGSTLILKIPSSVRARFLTCLMLDKENVPRSLGDWLRFHWDKREEGWKLQLTTWSSSQTLMSADREITALGTIVSMWMNEGNIKPV